MAYNRELKSVASIPQVPVRLSGNCGKHAYFDKMAGDLIKLHTIINLN